ncbi:MAG: YlxM family DNA-binding protein [Clostridia bacterium]|nr:YlxM family DNA-binding protein [Clostridia bacterium]
MSKNLEVSYLLDFYGDLLTDKQREAVEYYYNDDLSLSEIADNLKISRQGVRDSIKRAEAILFNMEKTLGLAQRFQTMQKGLDVIKRETEKIDRRNMKIYRSDDINESIKLILKTVDELCE